MMERSVLRMTANGVPKRFCADWNIVTFVAFSCWLLSLSRDFRILRGCVETGE